MKKQIVPVTLGLAAVCGASELAWVSPAQAANDSQIVGQKSSIPPEQTDSDSFIPPSVVDSEEISSATMPVEEEVEPMASRSASTAAETIALSFEPPPGRSPSLNQNLTGIMTQSTSAKSAPEPVQNKPGQSTLGKQSKSTNPQDLFHGGSESLVARTVGAAEGTRNPDGSKTSLYEGHVDPGNGVWNRGTFSYQFGNTENLSPEEADRRQMAKIKRIYESVMLSKAEQHGVSPLTLAEEINGIDLINQAPLTVTEEGGYIERLAEAKKEKGLQGEAAILEARVWSFWDGTKGGWDAPGLRAYDDLGKEASIRHDQQRRMNMIEEALTAYQHQNGAIAQSQPTQMSDQPGTSVPVSPSSLKRNDTQAEAIADWIISQDWPASTAPRVELAPQV